MVVCKSNGNVKNVEHYFNQGYTVTAIDTANRALGLTATSITFDQNIMTCSFTRENSNTNSKYFDISKSNPYILVAYGTIGPTGKILNYFQQLKSCKEIFIFLSFLDISYHKSRIASTNTVSLNQALPTLPEQMSSSTTKETSTSEIGINLLGASISYKYGTSSTEFIVTFPLPSDITQLNVWLGIGFNSAPAMVNISLFIYLQ